MTKYVSILVPEDAIMGSIDGPHKLLSEANLVLASMGKPAAFEMSLVGLTHNVRLSNGMFTVRADKLIHDVTRTDLIIVPAVQGDWQDVLRKNQEFMPWIVAQYKAGAEVASLCIGAFLLAATGLLKGRQCTTHWGFANEFRTLYPDIQLMDDKIITDEYGVYTGGGAYSSLNLVLYLIEKYAGRTVAIACAKIFAIEIDRATQAPFAMFRGQKMHDDDTVKQAQEFIEHNFREKITVDALADRFAMGRRNLERRFKKATANTVVEYIQRVKIEAAKMSLESTRENVNEVMYGVGYTDPKAFRMVFRGITGLTPIEYRNKYNRELAV